MRLYQRFTAPLTCRGQTLPAAVRPLRGALAARIYGEYVQDTLRLLLPRNALIAPGDRVLLDGRPYRCVDTRMLAGHLQADIRRCAG